MTADEMPLSAEEIMAQIEQSLWAGTGSPEEAWPPDLDPELRRHLVRLREMAGTLAVDSALQPSRLPVVGGLLTRLRASVHQLVLFYVNGLIRQQADFEQAVVRTLITLARHNLAGTRALRTELEQLRQQLASRRPPDGEG